MTDKKKQRNTADLLVECLEEEGVHYIFGIPGEENLAVMNALERSKIEFITVRHEQGASFMADVYGRLTGQAGVCMATLGPGATNGCRRCRQRRSPFSSNFRPGQHG